MKIQETLLSPRFARGLSITLAICGLFMLFALCVAVVHDTMAVFSMGYLAHYAPDDFDGLAALAKLFVRVPAVCTAFALAWTFRAIAQKQPIPREQISRLVMVACGFYVATGVVGVFQQLPMLLQTVRAFSDSPVGMMSAGLGVAFLGALDLATPFVYALGVYVLYLHFARLLVFEEEVA